MKYCQHCGSEINSDTNFCSKCGTLLNSVAPKKTIKAKWFFVFSGISAFLTLISGGIYIYQDMNMPMSYYTRGVLEEYAAIGSSSAIEDLNALDSFLALHSSLFYLFWFFLFITVSLLTTAILIKMTQKKKQ